MRIFVCAGCGIEYKTEVSQEDINEEYNLMYGHSQSESNEENVSVCGDCYDQVKAGKKDLGEEAIDQAIKLLRGGL